MYTLLDRFEEARHAGCPLGIRTTVNHAIRGEPMDHTEIYDSADRKETDKINTLNEHLSDAEFLLKKNWTIQTIEFKLNMIDVELSNTYNRTVMQKVEHRIKKADSISRKLIKKGHAPTFENAVRTLNDIVGIRVVCLYSDDVYKIAELLKQQKDFTLVNEKDYIKHPKKSGYQSLHLIMDVPLVFYDTTEYQRVEIQIRTVAMDFWAGVDNQICYKKSPEDIKKAEKDLKIYSSVISNIDRQMLNLRKKVENSFQAPSNL